MTLPFVDPLSLNGDDVTQEYKKPIEIADPLQLDVPDDELVKIYDKRIEESQAFFRKKDLYNRRKRNETYVLGRQLKEKESQNKIKPYEAKVLDNALYEIEQSIKPVAMGNLPDMIVFDPTTGGDNDETNDITKFVDDVIRKREIKNALATAFRHHPVYYTGVLKMVWNPEKNDAELLCIHPNKIDIDHTAISNDANKMRFISEKLPVTVQDVIIRFPEKEKEFREELTKHGIIGEQTPEWKAMASKIYIQEVHFTQHSKKKQPQQDPQSQPYDASQDEPGVKWEVVTGVFWKYDKVILKKMKDPNYDWEGVTKYYTYDDPSLEETKREVSPEEVMQSMMMGLQISISKEQIFRNYFEKPQSPYFFFGYDQWGEMAYDETSRVEQNIYNQENLDTRGKQITETLSNRGKHIWSKDGGMKASIIERMDMSDPEQDGLVEGNVNAVHKFIEPERPTSQEFNDMGSTRQKMFSVAGATNLSGTLQSDTATSNQIAREANYTRIDDLIDATINAACEWIAGWYLQFIKLRYTEAHYVRVLGLRGKQAYLSISSDSVTDGMKVAIKASGSDKAKRQRNAMDMAKLSFIDPLTFFEDMDMIDPEGRAERMITFTADPVTYLEKYVYKAPITPMPPAVDPAMAEQPQEQPAPEMSGQAATPMDTAQVQTEPPQEVAASPDNGML